MNQLVVAEYNQFVHGTSIHFLRHYDGARDGVDGAILVFSMFLAVLFGMFCKLWKEISKWFYRGSETSRLQLIGAIVIELGALGRGLKRRIHTRQSTAPIEVGLSVKL